MAPSPRSLHWFSRPIVGQALRRRIEQRRDRGWRRATQARVDVGLGLDVQQRRVTANRLADAPRACGAFHQPPTVGGMSSRENEPR